LLAATAVAQEEAPEADAPAADPTLAAEEGAAAEAEPTAEAEPAAGSADGGRFRFGIAGVAGLDSVSATGVSISGPMFGLDLRLGYQINDLIAIYAQPHLSFGSLSADVQGAVISGATGTFVATVLGEATFAERFFAGAGFGYGVLNNPSGLTLHLRAGVYPLMSRATNGPRRKGLMIGIDFRSVFIDGATGLLITGGLGYEAF
jgi:hypothetical protein